MTEEITERVCMNPDCKDNEYLVRYNCPTDRPIVRLGKVCWNCKTSDFLVDKNE